MGHEDGSVQSRYDHITAGMRQALMTALTEMWEQSLNARRAMSPGSPVAVLDVLLKGPPVAAILETVSKIFSRISPESPGKRDQGRCLLEDSDPDLVVSGRGGRI